MCECVLQLEDDVRLISGRRLRSSPTVQTVAVVANRSSRSSRSKPLVPFFGKAAPSPDRPACWEGHQSTILRSELSTFRNRTLRWLRSYLCAETPAIRPSAAQRSPVQSSAAQHNVVQRVQLRMFLAPSTLDTSSFDRNLGLPLMRLGH